jgi:antitoxin component YwqK of YwqJK toxin-antitoxin module
MAVSCNSKQTREEKFENGNPRIKYEVSENEDGSFEKNGYYKEWHENGQISLDGKYKNNLKDGKWVEFFDNGQKRSEYYYEKGQENGEWERWYESGQIQARLPYKSGLLNGTAASWYNNGEKESETEYETGKKNGKSIKWEEDGSLVKEMKYEYDENVTLVGKWNNDYKNAILTYYRDGLISWKDSTGKEEKYRYNFDGEELMVSNSINKITKITKDEYWGTSVLKDGTVVEFHAKRIPE